MEFPPTTSYSKDKKGILRGYPQQDKDFAKDAIAVYVLRKAGGINIARDAKQIHGYNIARYGKEKILAQAEQIKEQEKSRLRAKSRLRETQD